MTTFDQIMSEVFLAKVLISFLAGGAWIMTATWIADRYGTRAGGFIVGLPSTLFISLLFIGWTQSPMVAVAATTVVPVMGIVNTLFLLAYLVLVRAGFRVALCGSILLWTGCSLGLVLVNFRNVFLSLIIYVVVVVLSFLLAEKILHIESESGQKVKYTRRMLAFRGLFSGAIIALAVVMGKTGGPLWGGILAMFPALFLSTLFITYFSHGASFSAAVMKTALLTAMSIVLYGMAVRYTYVPFGLFWGTAVSLFISCGSGWVIHSRMVARLK